MATYQGQTVDALEDCEDSSLATGFSESDGGSRLTLADTAQYIDGAASHSILHTSAGTAAYIEYIWTPAASKVSCGLWYRTSTPGAWSGGPTFIEVIQTGVANLARLADQRSGGTNNRQICPAGLDSNIVNCTDATWYWVTFYYENGQPCKYRVYNASHELVGSEQSFEPIADADAGTIRFGASFGDTNQSGIYSYMDSLIVDYTSANFPLLGWSTSPGGGSTSAPHMMHLARQRRR